MRAVRVGAHGGPEVLTATDLPDPVPGDGEVLVDVVAAGVNDIDTYRRTGLYPGTPPFVPGLEGAGTVRAVGDGVGEIAAGDRTRCSRPWPPGPSTC